MSDKRLLFCFYDTRSEIRGVIGIEQPTIELLGIALGQQEGLGGFSLLIYIRKVHARVKSVVTATGEEEPAVVGTPIVKTFSPFAVYFVHCPCFPVFEIQQPEVSLWMPDGEITVVSLSIHQEAAVIRQSWPCDALTCLVCTDEGIYFRADLSCRLIETDAAETVFLLVIIGGVNLSAAVVK